MHVPIISNEKSHYLTEIYHKYLKNLKTKQNYIQTYKLEFVRKKSCYKTRNIFFSILHSILECLSTMLTSANLKNQYQNLRPQTLKPLNFLRK